MIYYIKNKQDQYFKIDYPCFGLLSILDCADDRYYSDDIEIFNESSREFEKVPCESLGGYIEGLRPSDLETLYMPLGFPLSSEDLSLPIFQHLSVGILGFCAGTVLKMDFKPVPCSELFLPLFLARNASLCEREKLYEMAMKEGFSPSQSTVIAATFYQTTSFYREGYIYLDQSDGEVFGASAIGRLVETLKGTMPVFTGYLWGQLGNGYQVCTDEYEQGDLLTNNMFFKSTEGWSGLLLNNLEDYCGIPEEKFRLFLKELKQHV